MKRKLLLAISFFVLVTGCGESSRTSSGASAEFSRAEAPTGTLGKLAAASPQVPAAIERRLVRTVDLGLRVTDTVAVSEAVQNVATEFGGHVASMTADRGDGTLFYSMTLRIPESRLDEAVRRIKSLAGRVDHESVKTEDVTERFVDLGARLKTLEATETELRALLAESRQRQQKTEDIMTVYRQLTEIRSNIEQARGQLNVLENLSALATINLTLSPTESPTGVVSAWHPLETIRTSFSALVAVSTRLVDIAIILVIVVLPPVAALGLLVWLGVKMWQALRRRYAVRG